MKKIIFTLSIIIFIPNIVFAQTYQCCMHGDASDCSSGTYINDGSCSGACTGEDRCTRISGGTTNATPIKLSNPLGDSASTDLNVIIGQIINGVLGIVGSLALVMFIYGGFVWMTAGGKSDAISKGKNIITWAVIGMIVIFTSYAAVRFILTSVINSGDGSDNSDAARNDQALTSQYL